MCPVLGVSAPGAAKGERADMMLEAKIEELCAIEDPDDRDDAIHDLAYEMIIAGATRMDVEEIERVIAELDVAVAQRKRPN